MTSKLQKHWPSERPFNYRTRLHHKILHLVMQWAWLSIARIHSISECKIKTLSNTNNSRLINHQHKALWQPEVNMEILGGATSHMPTAVWWNMMTSTPVSVSSSLFQNKVVIHVRKSFFFPYKCHFTSKCTVLHLSSLKINAKQLSFCTFGNLFKTTLRGDLKRQPDVKL